MHEELGYGSASTIFRLAKTLGFRHVHQRVRPILNAENKKRRLDWANDQLAKKEETETVCIHIDEKWFFAHILKRRFWVAPGEKPPQVNLESKNHITKVMFLGAVALPAPEYSFDGRVGLYPVAEQTIAVRRSKNRAKGDLFWKLVEMNASLFKKFLKESVVKDALVKTGTWAKKIIIQMDNAGGHGEGEVT